MLRVLTREIAQIYRAFFSAYVILLIFLKKNIATEGKYNLSGKVPVKNSFTLSCCKINKTFTLKTFLI